MLPSSHVCDPEDVIDDVLDSRLLRMLDIQERGHKGHHDDTAVGPEAPQHVVRHVPPVRLDAVGARVREDDGRAGNGQDVAHRVGRDVRQVDHHAEPVHLADEVAAEGREARIFVAACCRLVERRRPGRAKGVVAVVCERDVARAEVEQLAQRPQRVACLMPAFDPDHAGDLARLVGGSDAVGVGAEFEQVAVLRDEALCHVDLLEGVADSPLQQINKSA